MVKNYKEKIVELRYNLMCLGYYSFQYDLSKSVNKEKSFRYYDILKDLHNYYNAEALIIEYENYLKICKDVFISKYKDIIYENEKIRYINDLKLGFSKSFSNYTNKNEVARIEALQDCNKNYPDTVKENIQIFKDYLELMGKYDILPIIVICPVTKHYMKYYSNKIKNEFYDILRDIKIKYNIIILDYFSNNNFNNNDFYNASHLNNIGAKKFASILYNDLGRYIVD